MNWGDVRSLIRRRLNEPEEVVGGNWTNSMLLLYGNVAYAFVQKKVRGVNREAIAFTELRTLNTTSEWYEKPENTTGVIEVAIRTEANGEFTKLKRVSKEIAESTDVGSDPVYCHLGNYIGIFPLRTTQITEGLRLRVSPNDQLSDDSDELELEITLQFAVVLYAAILAKGESPEDDGKDQRDLAAILADIPVDYGDLDQSPVPLSPNVADSRGFTGGGTLRNDVDPGRL